MYSRRQLRRTFHLHLRSLPVFSLSSPFFLSSFYFLLFSSCSVQDALLHHREHHSTRAPPACGQSYGAAFSRWVCTKSSLGIARRLTPCSRAHTVRRTAGGTRTGSICSFPYDYPALLRIVCCVPGYTVDRECRHDAAAIYTSYEYASSRRGVSTDCTVVRTVRAPLGRNSQFGWISNRAHCEVVTGTVKPGLTGWERAKEGKLYKRQEQRNETLSMIEREGTPA